MPTAIVFSLSQVSAIPDLTVDMAVVFGLIVLALGLFALEFIPIDLTAILMMVLTIILGRWTHISVEEGISGFSSTAAVAVIALLIIGAGLDRTGVVQMVGERMASFAEGDLSKQLTVTTGVAGSVSGFIGDTVVVAILLPVTSDLARQGRSSPSKLLIPLSYAAMLGGTLTLIGTGTNLLASEASARLLNHPFSMFEFTHLGILVLITGVLYLVTIGHRLLPERLPPEEFGDEPVSEEYLTEVVVRKDAPIIGMTVEETRDASEFAAEIVDINRSEEPDSGAFAQTRIRSEDILSVRADRETLKEIMDIDGLFVGNDGTGTGVQSDGGSESVVEAVIPVGSGLVGESATSIEFQHQYDARILAVRTRRTLGRKRLGSLQFRVGDTLLLQAPAENLDRLSQNRAFLIAHEPDEPDYRTSKIPLALGIILGVVALPALDITSIIVSGYLGVILMVIGGILRPHEIYDAVPWDVIFLLAGVYPLGLALEQTGAAALFGGLVAASADFLPAIGILWVFYAMTAVLTNIISNNASVILMVPVAVEAGQSLGANAFAFVLAVTFAASTAFLTPIGYQTNLFVYGPGGYRFTDYFRIGAPLQVLLSVVTVVGITVFWGVGL